MCKSNIRNWQGLLKIWTLSFLLLGFIGIFTSQNTHAGTAGVTTESIALTEAGTPNAGDNLEVLLLQLFRSPITGGELSEYGTAGTALVSLVSVFLGAAMSTNLFVVSGDWGKAIPAMFGTFFLAAENVFRVLKVGTYKSFYHRYTCQGNCPNGQQWVDLLITLTAVGSGVIISVADADSAGTGMATLCESSDENSGSIKTNYFNCTQCTGFNDGYYKGCPLPGTGNQTEVASDPYNTCEKGLYALGVTINGIPTAVVGATAMHQVFMHLKTLGYDTFSALNTLRKGASEMPFIAEVGKKAMGLKGDVLDVLKALQETSLAEQITYLAQKFRQDFKPEEAYQAIQHAKTLEPMKSNALLGAAGGVAQVVGLAAVSFVGISTLTDVFNSGKNLDYIKRNGFNLIPKKGGGYVVQFPDGTVVDPEHKDYEINKAFVQSFKDNMESADGAMIRSQMTYYAQSIMVGLAGVISPYLIAKGLGEVLVKSRFKLKDMPVERLYFPSLVLSLAMTSTGFHFYGENLDGAEESIKQLSAYRKATGEDSYIDYLLTPWQKIQLSKALLAGVFTVGGAVAIRPYVSLGMHKAGNLFFTIYHFCKN